MASTSSSPADRRRAHVRVGTAATAAFAALLLLTLVTHGSAEADRTVPSAAPATTEQPQQTAPGEPGFRRDRRGPGRRGGGSGPGFGGGGEGPGFGGGGGSAPDGGGVAPVPNTGENTT